MSKSDVVREHMTSQHGADVALWPKCGCGARFRPWRKGDSQVMEFYSHSAGAGMPTNQSNLKPASQLNPTQASHAPHRQANSWRSWRRTRPKYWTMR